MPLVFMCRIHKLGQKKRGRMKKKNDWWSSSPDPTVSHVLILPLPIGDPHLPRRLTIAARGATGVIGFKLKEHLGVCAIKQTRPHVCQRRVVILQFRHGQSLHGKLSPTLSQHLSHYKYLAWSLSGSQVPDCLASFKNPTRQANNDVIPSNNVRSRRPDSPNVEISTVAFHAAYTLLLIRILHAVTESRSVRLQHVPLDSLLDCAP